MKDKEKQLVNEIKQDFKMQEEKHKQFEETIKEIAECNKESCKDCKITCTYYYAIKRFCELYLSEDSVVLSSEEYENKKIIVEMSGGHKLKLTIGKFGEMSKVLEEYTRKETAEKIYRMADEICTGSQNDGDKILAMIKDNFGVEIKE